jgi:hypothetical protein
MSAKSPVAQEIRAALVQSGYLTPEQWPRESHQTGHWLMNALLSTAAFIGAIFLIAAVASISGAMLYFIAKDGVMLLYALIFGASALAIDRAKWPDSIFGNVATKLSTAMVIAAVALTAGFIMTHMTGINYRHAAGVCASLFAGAFFLYRESATRVLAVLGATTALWIAVAAEGSFRGSAWSDWTLLPTALVAAALALCFHLETRKVQQHRLLAPAITGLALALIALATALCAPRALIASSIGVTSGGLTTGQLIAAAAVIGIPFVTAAWVTGHEPDARRALFAAVLTIALIPIPELIAVAFVATVAFARGTRPLLWLAALATPAAIGIVYYSWQTNLAVKAAAMAVTGVVLAVLVYIVRLPKERSA